MVKGEKVKGAHVCEVVREENSLTFVVESSSLKADEVPVVFLSYKGSKVSAAWTIAKDRNPGVPEVCRFFFPGHWAK